MNKLFLALLIPAFALGLTAQDAPKAEKPAACCKDSKACDKCKDTKACKEACKGKEACKDKKACAKHAEKK
ncbi:MAG: hypothetical protein Q8O00_01150 [Holophaga sp.]|nr:hypothetical protein [Holophaga sp.]